MLIKLLNGDIAMMVGQPTYALQLVVCACCMAGLVLYLYATVVGN